MTSAAIIGGYGGMGRLFARVLKRNGLDVILAGPRAEKGRAAAKELKVRFESDNKKAVKAADLVIVSVPINKTVAVIREVAPVLKKGALLMDLTSVKKAPCEAMSAFASPAVEVVGCHPIFGPMTPDFKNQNFVFCPVRPGKMFAKVKGIVKKEGGRVTECTPGGHDSAMGVIQGMTHFMLISAGMAMRDLDFDLQKAKDLSSPVYSLVMDMVGRILGQDPRLYGEIQLNNPTTKAAREAYLRAAERLDSLIKGGDEAGFIREMASAAEHFGDTKGALERTQKLLKDLR